MEVGRISQGYPFAVKGGQNVTNKDVSLSIWSLSMENKEMAQESVLKKICLKVVKVSIRWCFQSFSKSILVYNKGNKGGRHWTVNSFSSWRHMCACCL